MEWDLSCFIMVWMRNRVEGLLKEEFGRNVLEVNRVSERVMCLKLLKG